MKKVLLTAIGGDIGQGVARIIRLARPEWQLLGTDIHEQHAGRLFVDSFFLMPPASSPNYLSRLDALISAEDIDVVIPMSEPELVAVIDMMSCRLDVEWISPGPSVVRYGADKLTTARKLELLGLQAPWTVSAESEMPLEYPCIYKHRTGAGGRGLLRVNNDKQARELKGQVDAIFQELLLPDDSEVTCAVYRTRDRRTAVLQMKRRLVDSATGWAKVIYDADVQSLCLAIAEGLDLCGSMNIQLRITPSGPRVFEINPRYSSTAWMRHLIGFKDVVWALDEQEGLSVVFPEIDVGVEMVRFQDAAVLPRAGK